MLFAGTPIRIDLERLTMKITHERKVHGFWLCINHYYNKQRWLCVTDDFGNLVKIDYDAVRVSLGGGEH